MRGSWWRPTPGCRLHESENLPRPKVSERAFGPASRRLGSGGRRIRSRHGGRYFTEGAQAEWADPVAESSVIRHRDCDDRKGRTVCGRGLQEMVVVGTDNGRLVLLGNRDDGEAAGKTPNLKWADLSVGQLVVDDHRFFSVVVLEDKSL